MWVRDIKSLSPSQFELMVKDQFEKTGINIDDFVVKHNEKLIGLDGEYNIDITINYKALGVNFVVLVECKNHKNPIKRELVQIFKEKIASLGAHKGIMFSSAKFQSGAIEYAMKHGIALIQLSEGNINYVNRSFVQEHCNSNGFMFWLVYMKENQICYNTQNAFINSFIKEYMLSGI